MRRGAWTGSIGTTDDDVVHKSVTKERWKLVQSKVQWLAEHVDLKDENLTHKPDCRLDKTQAPPGKIKFGITERFVHFFCALLEGHLSHSELLASRKKYGGLATNRIRKGWQQSLSR